MHTRPPPVFANELEDALVYHLGRYGFELGRASQWEKLTTSLEEQTKKLEESLEERGIPLHRVRISLNPCIEVLPPILGSLAFANVTEVELNYQPLVFQTSTLTS